MAFPTTGLLDNFNRADAALNSIGNWGSAYYPGDKFMQITSNVARGSVNADSNDTFWSAAQFGSNQEVWYDVPALPGTGGGEISYLTTNIVSPSGTSFDGYEIDVRRGTTGTVQWYRVDNITYTQLGANLGQTIAAGDSFGMENKGSVISFYRQNASVWSFVGSQVSNTYHTTSYIGFGARGSNFRIDNFSGGDIVTQGNVRPGRRSLMGVGI